MWFGTESGLNRYDGYHFVVVRHYPFDSTSISASEITALFADSRRRLWVGTRGGGVDRFDRARALRARRGGAGARRHRIRRGPRRRRLGGDGELPRPSVRPRARPLRRLAIRAAPDTAPVGLPVDVPGRARRALAAPVGLARAPARRDGDGSVLFYEYHDLAQLPPGAALPSSTIRNRYEECFDFGSPRIICGTIDKYLTPSGVHRPSFPSC